MLTIDERIANWLTAYLHSEEPQSKLAEAAHPILVSVQLDRAWIPVDEQLPEGSDYYLVVLNDGTQYIRIRFYSASKAEWNLSHQLGEVTHWQVIPDLPEVTE